MPTDPSGPEPSGVDWDADGAPRSRRFDDIYFSSSNGLAESRAVYLAGCGLPDAWRGRRRFVVGELGFGTGLNVLALLDLWRRTREPGARLHVFSVEAFPLTSGEAARALAPWPELSDLAAPLIPAWPTTPGFHRLDFAGIEAVLDVAVMEAADALGAWDGRADAWFLDGFSPARNPQMWRPEVLEMVAARSAPGARAATFTVAGAVRRGLAAAGFRVDKRPGFGGKSERLEARLERSEAPSTSAPGRVCIVGAGVAGASLARAFRAAGTPVTVIEAAGPGAGASGNPAALVTPRFDAGGGPVARLHAQAFARAIGLYDREAPGAIIARGALQLEIQDRDERRFDRLAQSDLFAPDALARLDEAEAGARLGEPAGSGGLWIEGALTIEPQILLRAWLEDAELLTAEVDRLERAGDAWRLLDPDGGLIAEAGTVILAGGFASRRLAPGLPLEPVRGQASFTTQGERPTAAAWGGYAIPTRTGVLFGATHDRGQDDSAARPEDQARNLATLAARRPGLAAGIGDAPLGARAGVRAASPDRSPLAGPVGQAPGLLVLTGLGGRGFTLAPLLGEHIAAVVLGAPSPLPAPLAAMVGLERFSPGSAGPGNAAGKPRAERAGPPGDRP